MGEMTYFQISFSSPEKIIDIGKNDQLVLKPSVNGGRKQGGKGPTYLLPDYSLEKREMHITE